MPSKLLARLALAGTIAFGALPAFAQDAPQRLALVIGEANYAGGPLQTVAADATLVAQSLTAEGFDVSEFHDLDHSGLADNTAAFLNKVRAAPPGAAITVYLSGIGAIADCDDVLLPVDAHIASPADVARQGLSMTKLMRDLSATSSLVRLVMLDGARPAPPEVSSVALPRGLLPLHAPHATTFGLSAEIHDFAPSPQPGDTNSAYAASFASVAQQPLTDLETSMRSVRMATHQATGGAQTPWQDTNPDTPSFSLALNVDPQQAQGVAETLPNSTSPIGKLGPDDAYLAVIWRNSIPDYQAYLDAFKATAPSELLSRVRTLLELLKTPNPSCEAAAAPPLPPPPPRRIVAGPLCPEGFVPEDGYNGAYCAPINPPPQLVCPPGLVRVDGVEGFGCAPVEPPQVLDCPVGFRVYGDRDRLRRLGLSAYCEPEQPPPFVCPPDLHVAFHDGRQFCVRNGPPPPLCPPQMHPIWDGQGAYQCYPNPTGEPIMCQGGRPQWNFDHWICVNAPGRRADFCRPGEIQMWQEGRAICAPPPPPASLCPPGYFAVGGSCVADILPGIAIGVGVGAAIGIGSHWGHGGNGGPPDGVCAPGQPRVNGHCVLPPGGGGPGGGGPGGGQGGGPRPPGPGAGNGPGPQGGAGACPAGAVVVNGHCMPQPGPGGAHTPGGNGQPPQGGAGACAAGQIVVNGHCMPQPGPGGAHTPGGAPACAAGQIVVNGHCVAQPGPAATSTPGPTAQPTPVLTPRPTPPAGNGQGQPGPGVTPQPTPLAQPTPHPTPAVPAQPTPHPTPAVPAQPTPPAGNGQGQPGPGATPHPTPTLPAQPTPHPTPAVPAQPTPLATPRPTPPAGNGQGHQGEPVCPGGGPPVNGHCGPQPGPAATPKPLPTLPAQPKPMPVPTLAPKPPPPLVPAPPKAPPPPAPPKAPPPRRRPRRRRDAQACAAPATPAGATEA